MHFEIHVEDLSGKKALSHLVPKILGDDHTFNIHSYKGIGHIPANLKGPRNIRDKTILGSLGRILQGYGHAYAKSNFSVTVVIVCDLDDHCFKVFRTGLGELLSSCCPKPPAVFCIAIEEMEAWLLGDVAAITAAYPKTKEAILKQYTHDSICGTWELLADAIYPGGAGKLKKMGWSVVGQTKSEWADKIAPFMDIDANKSPSFRYFLQKLRSRTIQ